MTDTPTPDLTAPEHVGRVCREIHDTTTSRVIPVTYGVRWQGTLSALAADLKAAEAERDSYRKTANEMAERTAKAEAERDAALDALEPFSIMAGVLFAMNYEMSDDVFSIKSAHGEVAMTFESFLNARAAARQKVGEG